ncbi:MAG: IS110 family transposase [Pseudonocardiaceae bacterium]
MSAPRRDWSLGQHPSCGVVERPCGDSARAGDGRLVDALLQAGHPVVPVKPNAIKIWRDSEVLSGAKSDAGDAEVIAEYRRLRHHRLRLATPYSPETKALRTVVRTRGDLGAKRLTVFCVKHRYSGRHRSGARCLRKRAWVGYVMPRHSPQRESPAHQDRIATPARRSADAPGGETELYGISRSLTLEHATRITPQVTGPCFKGRPPPGDDDNPRQPPRITYCCARCYCTCSCCSSSCNSRVMEIARLRESLDRGPSSSSNRSPTPTHTPPRRARAPHNARPQTPCRHPRNWASGRVVCVAGALTSNRAGAG